MNISPLNLAACQQTPSPQAVAHSMDQDWARASIDKHELKLGSMTTKSHHCQTGMRGMVLGKECPMQ